MKVSKTTEKYRHDLEVAYFKCMYFHTLLNLWDERYKKAEDNFKVALIADLKSNNELKGE